jgi:hypothetical protein
MLRISVLRACRLSANRREPDLFSSGHGRDHDVYTAVSKGCARGILPADHGPLSPTCSKRNTRTSERCARM